MRSQDLCASLLQKHKEAQSRLASHYLELLHSNETWVICFERILVLFCCSSLYTTDTGILQELNPIHDRDGALFKGIFMRCGGWIQINAGCVCIVRTVRLRYPGRFNCLCRRNLRMLIDVLPSSDSNKQTYEKFVQDNMMSMVQHARTPLGEYGAYWQGPVGTCQYRCSNSY